MTKTKEQKSIPIKLSDEAKDKVVAMTPGSFNWSQSMELVVDYAWKYFQAMERCLDKEGK